MGSAPTARCAVRVAHSRWTIRRGLPKYGQPFESHAGAMQMAPSSPGGVNGKSSLAGAFCFFLAETVGFEPTIQV
jgi:hypothetical protein